MVGDKEEGKKEGDWGDWGERVFYMFAVFAPESRTVKLLLFRSIIISLEKRVST